ncbi:Two-component response regulator-like APRR5 [Bienertia sinuspersici]
MGEVVVSSEDGVEIMEVEKEEEKKKVSKEVSSSTVRWDNFLPRLGLRILLVEADDSTRQIIGALLRKCSYKVASVADGLKAWEVLKARPHNIDLILTEAELPSISGYALLTLIMEHEVCKNIPVIMMSTHDSVSMVYKCMLRGAADFLVKPIRINELKNLWQHVWRRQSQLNRGGGGGGGGGVGPQDESVAQEKLEATAENNATSDHSSSSKTCAPRQDPCIKKGSDAQSSCGKQDLEAERSGTAAFNSNNAIDQDQKAEQQIRRENVNLYSEATENRDHGLTSSSREAIDFIGVLDSPSKRNVCSNDAENRLGPSQQLDLTLMRFLPSVLETKTSSEKQMLNHSNASAFTRYVNKASNMSNSNPTSDSPPKENNKVNPCDHSSDNAPESNYNAKDYVLPSDRRVISLPTNLSKEVENEYRNASAKLFPIQFPVRGVRVDVCPMVCTTSPSPSPSSANQQMNSYPMNIDLRQHYHPLDQSPKLSSNQPISVQDQKLESLEERAHFSSAADQSASSSLHNDTAGAGHLNGGGSDGGNDQTHVTRELNRQRSLQREAALNKFRLKRKERCYEKKVRYESRKKLAEQRPRVKGQFVRQVPPDPPPLKSDQSGGNSAVN